ncbi:MAG TPA: ABC transporter permease [Bryobacteraceae bacterium]|nr:ABC transporter permease [Bryobacteraceae bacterium]
MTAILKRASFFWGKSAGERRDVSLSLAALIAICLLAIAISPTAFDGSRIFLELGNLTDILRQVSIIGIISLAMTFVILTGGIDLSVGSILALSTSVVALVLTHWNPGGAQPFVIAVAMLAALAVSTAAGAFQGAVIALFEVQPFVVTLAGMIGIRGLAKWLSNNANIDIGFGRDVASTFAGIFRGKSVIIGCYIGLALIFGLLLSWTVFGRHVRATGDNERASRYAGLPIRRIKVLVYALSGLLSGVAGILYAAENHQGNPNSGIAYELDAIAAVVIGGTRLSGGKGTILGTIVGTLMIGVLTNMLRLNNVDSNVEMMVKAVIIILAVAVQRQGRVAQ